MNFGRNNSYHARNAKIHYCERYTVSVCQWDLSVVRVRLSVNHYVIKTDCFLEENALKLSISALRTVTFRCIFLESQFNQAIEQKSFCSFFALI